MPSNSRQPYISASNCCLILLISLSPKVETATPVGPHDILRFKAGAMGRSLHLIKELEIIALKTVFPGYGLAASPIPAAGP